MFVHLRAQLHDANGSACESHPCAAVCFSPLQHPPNGLQCCYSSADIYLHAAPLFHIGGLNSALAMLAAGAKHIFLPRFDPVVALSLMLRHGVTSFIAVPTMVADLAEAAAAARLLPLRCVRRLLLGGGGTSPALLAAIAELFPAAQVQSAYGMTEAASSITFSTVRTPCSKASSSSGADSVALTLDAPQADDAAAAAAGVYVGRPPPGIELAVYQTDGLEGPLNEGSKDASSCGRITQQGFGEVLTRGPHLLLHYWGDPEATAAVLLPGGWMRTGDLGYLCRVELRRGQQGLVGHP